MTEVLEEFRAVKMAFQVYWAAPLCSSQLPPAHALLRENPRERGRR
jgi:hypothetical protein